MQEIRVSTLLAILGLAIGGCGGGGGDNSPTPPPADASGLQTSIPGPTYASGSLELSYFERINAFRRTNGLGLLAQSTTLDQVAINHSAYLDSHDSSDEYPSGIELPGYSGFTGATAQDRCDHAGYAGTCLQTAMWSQPDFIGVPSAYLGLLVLEQGEREIGITVPLVFGGQSCDPLLQLVLPAYPPVAGMPLLSCGPHLQLGLPARTAPQQQEDSFLLVTGLWSAIHIQIKEGLALSITHMVVTDTANNIVAGDLITSSNDPQHRVAAHAAIFVPSFPATCGATYNVEMWGVRQGLELLDTRSIVMTCL
jgi:hypothetical protein